MSESEYPERDYARYASLGLIANPFVFNQRAHESAGMSAEIVSASNRLFREIVESANAERPGPLVVDKTTDYETYYSSRAVSEIEYSLIHDESLNVLHAYVPLFALRRGRVRATLNVVAERLAFRSFDRTLALYVEKVLASPDESLASYQAMGPDVLAKYRAEFEQDGAAAVTAWFGEMEIEKRPELSEIADTRLMGLDTDVEESPDATEYDPAIGDAPATVNLIEIPGEEEEIEEEHAYDDIVGYILEHTKANLSPVVARGLRVYRERGLAAMTFEWGITKAPKKTLAALVRLARLRFKKVAIVYDGFENWHAMDSQVMTKVLSAFSEMRWMLDGDAFLVFLLESGVAPQLREQFASAQHIEWDFSGLKLLAAHEGEAVPELIDRWFAAASIGASPALSMTDPVLSALAEKAEGQMDAFIGMARAAVEDAAARGVEALDEHAHQAGLAAEQEQ